MNRSKTRLIRHAVVATTAALVLAACGGGEGGVDAEQPSPTPSPSPSSKVPVPAGIQLSDVGADLTFGDSATVIFEPNQKRGSVLELTVRGATKGSIKDFSGFVLDDYTRGSTPYYVDVTVKNVGEGNVGGSAVPLWGVDGKNTLLPPASFTTTFRRCPSEPFPKKFAAGATHKTCLVFLAPDKGRMDAVSFRPNQAFDPIRWTGDIKTPKPAAKKKSDKN